MNFSRENSFEVLVVHAEPLLMLGICAALGEEPGWVVRSVRSAGSAPPTRQDGSEVIVADYESAMQILNAGSAPSSQPSSRKPRSPVVVLSARNSQREIRSALELGVLGYLTPACSARELADGVRAARRGKRWIGVPVAERVADCLSQDPLTLREQDVLSLMAPGLSNKAIASKLGLQVGTVKCHVQSILAKLDAASRTEAVARALHLGIA